MGTSAEELREWVREPGSPEPGRQRQFLDLHARLDAEFRYYHAARQRLSSTASELNALTGEEFETHVARLLERLGFTGVRGTPRTGDQGADLVATKNARVIVVQAKRYADAVGNAAVQEVVAALRFYDGHEAWVVTNSTFTKSALALAQANDVRLIDGTELRELQMQANSRLQT